MASVLDFSVVDRGSERRSCQNKDNKIVFLLIYRKSHIIKE
jgi:hypothetical protein